jgi:hypothetical protein
MDLKSTFRYLALGVFASGLLACAHTTRQELLVKNSANFHNELRWKRLNEAAMQVAPWEKEAFFAAYRDRSETLQIEDYELESIAFPLPGTAGYADEPTMATIHINRYEVEAPEVTRRKIKREEKWIYHDRGWFITRGY